MTATFEIDAGSVARLESTMAKYELQMHKASAYVVNRTLQNVAGWAAHYTRKADYQKLVAELELTYRTVSLRKPFAPRKKPKLITTAAALKNTVAAARHAARLRMRYPGRPIPPAAEFYAGVARMIAKTLRSIAFMKAGWLPAFRALKVKQAAAAQSEQSAFGSRTRPGYGGSIRAVATTDGATGEIYNTSINPKNKTSWWALSTYGGEGLNLAVSHVTADMEKYMAEEHAKAKAAASWAA